MNIAIFNNVSPRLAQFLSSPDIPDLQAAIGRWADNKAAGIGLEAGGELLELALLFGVTTPKEAARTYKARLDAASNITTETRLTLLSRYYDNFMAEAISWDITLQDEYQRNAMEWAW